MKSGQIVNGKTPDGTWYEFRTGEGPIVVLVHGLGLNHSMWQWQLDALSLRYRVLTYDLLGSGRSIAPDSPLSLTAFSRQLASLLDELKITQIALAGFSLGGMIVRRFAMDYPSRVAALAIINSAYKRDSAATDAIQQRVDQAKRDGPAATVDAALERWFTTAYRQQHPEVMDTIRNLILANDKTIYPRLYQVLVDGVNELVNPEPPISCPTLVMTAEQDYGNSVEMAHCIAGEIPKAVITILPALRHMAMVESPDLFNRELLAFLDSVIDGEQCV